MSDELKNWLESGEYLPEILRDFHDQKDIFKVMHMLYQQDAEQAKDMPNWVNGQIYTIDWFLWFMASRGFTLQKSRKDIDFRPIEKWRDLYGPGIDTETL